MAKHRHTKKSTAAAALAGAEKWQDRIAEALVVILLCIQPLYLNTERYVGLTGHKFMFFAVNMGMASFAAFAVWFYKKASGLPPRPGERLLSVAEWAVLGFAAVTLLSAIFSPYSWAVNVWTGKPEPYGRYDGAITQVFYVVAFLIISRWYKPRERDLAVFGISACLVAFLGILQFYGMDFLKLWPNDLEGIDPATGVLTKLYYAENFYNIIFRSTLGNVNIVSTYVCVAVLLCGFLFVRTTSKWRFVWLAGSALNFWLMILASSYSGMVGTLVTVFIALPFILDSRAHLGRFMLLGSSWAGVFALQKLFYDVMVLEAGAGGMGLLAAAAAVLLAAGLALTVLWKEKAPDAGPDAPVKWKLGVIVIISAVAVGLAGVEVLGRRGEEGPDSYKDALYQAREILHGNISDEFGTNRVYIWRNALKAFPEHPVLGTGPDTFEYAFPAEAQWRYGEKYDKAHNEYLQILICQGILGLLCYLVFLGALFARTVPKAFKNPLLMAALAAFFGYCVQAFFNISLPIASQMLWVLAGIMTALIKSSQPRPEKM